MIPQPLTVLWGVRRVATVHGNFELPMSIPCESRPWTLSFDPLIESSLIKNADYVCFFLCIVQMVAQNKSLFIGILYDTLSSYK
jgi:hypothetical protein